MKKRNIDYSKVLEIIQLMVKRYLRNNNVKSVVCGVSGGLDSGVNMAILSRVCKELNINLIGRYIHIETNKEDEEKRAEIVGKLYATDYKNVDLTEMYLSSLPFFSEIPEHDDNISRKIRFGNIKARLRMIYLYNLASMNKGLVLDNDNLTERELGFWTLNGDVGDLTPLSSLYKTEVFDLARFMLEQSDNEEEKKILEDLINATPTDGLGITNSDVEQFGVSSYEEVDDVLMTLIPIENSVNIEDTSLYKDLVYNHGKEVVDSVWRRHVNSNFKRKWPKRILFDAEHNLDSIISREKILEV